MSVDFEYLGLKDEPPRRVEYHQAWGRQRAVHAAVAADEIPGRVLFVEHDAVYTAGKQTLPEERPFDGTPVVDVDRGGKITWHGPGQLVGYPIMKLPDRVGVVDHVRRVEQAVIELLAHYGIIAGRVPGRTGVWLPADDPDFVPPIEAGPHHARSVGRTGYFTPGIPEAAAQPDAEARATQPNPDPRACRGAVPGFQLASIDGQQDPVGHQTAVPAADGPRILRPERKICAIGIRVTKRTTMHGFALNITNSTAGFDNIVPCGIPDAGVTSMAEEMAGPTPSLLEVAERLEPLLATHLSREGNLNQ
ncbi:MULTISPECIES: lipoyl(octanoyl) transferase LipB [unclassified Luteococcus]|uniref:lipoyl(octanoyl) transferase LipB n=1 Tax=unclassified Luteococcus TaxID=2639923 RepID=UPI00313AA816